MVRTPAGTVTRFLYAAGASLTITILASPQQLAPVVVEVERPGIYGVVGDTAYRALAGTLVPLRRAGSGGGSSSSLPQSGHSG